MNRPLIIAIAGGSGSGKTYLANEIAAAGQGHVSVLSMDQYFREIDHQTPEDINFDHPTHLDFKLMLGHLRAIKSGRSVKTPEYDFRSMRRLESKREIKPTRVVILEGLFVLAEPIAGLCDVTCFLDVATDERLLGRILRDTRERGATIEGVVDRYQRFVRPSYKVFVEPTKENADIVVDFTYRRALFSKLITHLITDTISAQIDPEEFVRNLRGTDFAFGGNLRRGYMPVSVDILKLSKAYPETIIPHDPQHTLLASPAATHFGRAKVESKNDPKSG